jgi:hypothetical protein
MKILSNRACVWALAAALTTVPGRSASGADSAENRGDPAPTRPIPESSASGPLPKIIRGPLLPLDSGGNPPHGRESVRPSALSNSGTTSLGPLPRIIAGPLPASSGSATVVGPKSGTSLQSPPRDAGLIGSLRQIGADVNRTGMLQAIPSPQSGGPTDLIQNLRELEQSINSNGILQRIRGAGTTNDAPAGLIESLRGVDHAVRTQVRPALERISKDQLPSKVLRNDVQKP